jgi:hypothetical protein
MTKPVIVNRVTKGSPLTTAEHDANFTNLQNATVGLRAGSAGTTVTADLNGVITLVAGSGVTFTGDNTAKTITVAAGSANLVTNNIQIGESDLTQVSIQPPTGFTAKSLNLKFNLIDLNAGGSGFVKVLSQGADVSFGASDANRMFIDNGIDTISLLTDQYDGTVEIGADRLSLRAEDGLGSLNECRLILGNYTTTERNSIATPSAGTLLFNETTNKFQGYDGTNWVDLH